MKEKEMSRFQLLGAYECVTASGRRRLRSGQTIADSVGNAQPGDIVSSQLCTAPNRRMIALDAAAVTALGAVGITATIGQQLSHQPSGVESVDA
jgi:hypothetical protein